MPKRHAVTIEGRVLHLSNLDKVLYPKVGFSKAQVIDFYRRIAPVLLPHLSSRPLTLKRYPDGVDREAFYEKNCPAHHPSWVPTAPVWSEANQKVIRFCLVQDLPTLLWVANLASLELHLSLSKAEDLERPSFVVFDLDPGPPAALLDCVEVALWLRDLLSQLGLESFVKTSGKKGLQLYVPLHSATTYKETKSFAHAIARYCEKEQPDRVVSFMKKELRRGKVFVDWSQNDVHKTTVSVYSLRAEDEPSVSTPITWQELEVAGRRRQPEVLRFLAASVLARVEKEGDLFAPVLTLVQRLPAFSESLLRGRSRPNVRSRFTEYAQKRHFEVTPEPPPAPIEKSVARPRSFMIHKHHARRLHYDLRLEMGGVLASWAIPKGPSYDPEQKRLAVETEDHPIAYGDFEGRIPEGEYGAGDSIIWDRGLYETVPPGQASAQREKGHLDLVFLGEKLKGHFHLIRTRSGPANKPQWLFFKAKDDLEALPREAKRGDLVTDRPESVVSGRRITRGPVARRELRGPPPAPELLLRRVFPPMLATSREHLPSDEKSWILEVKYDGYRAIAAISGRRLAMWTRNALDLTARFPALANSLERLVVGEAVLDGEIVALDRRGRPHFERLGEGGEQLYVFDLLHLDGRDLRGEPIEIRRELLAGLLAHPPPSVHLVETLQGGVQGALDAMRRRGFEGIVAKRLGSRYEGRRSNAWMKLKVEHRQELAIIGYSVHSADPKQIGALFLGVVEGGVLRYAGKVGTGFSADTRRQLKSELLPDRVERPLVKDAPRMRGAVWITPRRVAEVRFSEWTADGRLRHPVFVGLRVDKRPEECVRE
jgi:DNA ligase D-like protein (predicted polymerase)/DNA ligase D-like protein (predicted ligase)/DNA ligase D-like protein (predicted 3'-phosphoesterase)